MDVHTVSVWGRLFVLRWLCGWFAYALGRLFVLRWLVRLRTVCYSGGVDDVFDRDQHPCTTNSLVCCAEASSSRTSRCTMRPQGSNALGEPRSPTLSSWSANSASYVSSTNGHSWRAQVPSRMGTTIMTIEVGERMRCGRVYGCARGRRCMRCTNDMLRNICGVHDL